MAINLGTGSVIGYHRRKAAESNTSWVIHWKDGRSSIHKTTNDAYEMARGNMASIKWMENKSMRPFITNCLRAIKRDILVGANDVFFSYIGDDMYEACDPATGDTSTLSDWEVRLKIQIHYTRRPDAYEEDSAYIEERLRDLA